MSRILRFFNVQISENSYFRIKLRLYLKIGAAEPDVAYSPRVDDSAESASARQDHIYDLSFLKKTFAQIYISSKLFFIV